MTTTRTLTLDQALGVLGGVAESAGVPATTARSEGSALAAAVADRLGLAGLEGPRQSAAGPPRTSSTPQRGVGDGGRPRRRY